MVPFLYSIHQLLLSASTLADCCHFLNITIEDAIVIPQSLWPYDPLIFRYMTSQLNIQSPLILEDFQNATFSHETHLIYTTTSKSL
jgi:hypothetical protein